MGTRLKTLAGNTDWVSAAQSGHRWIQAAAEATAAADASFGESIGRGLTSVGRGVGVGAENRRREASDERDWQMRLRAERRTDWKSRLDDAEARVNLGIKMGEAAAKEELELTVLAQQNPALLEDPAFIKKAQDVAAKRTRMEAATTTAYSSWEEAAAAGEGVDAKPP